MKVVTNFKALYCSGFFIPNPAAITAMSLLFEKVFLPNNLNLIKEFSKRFLIQGLVLPPQLGHVTLKITCNGKPADPFKRLSPAQRKTALSYLNGGMLFSMAYSELFDEVFESNLFEEKTPYEVELIKKGRKGKLNTYKVKLRPMILHESAEEEERESFSNMIEEGYIPLVTKYIPFNKQRKNLHQTTAKQLAVLLAMKSVEMILPCTKAASPEDILEARNKLKDHLPPFWSAMLKLSSRLKECIKKCSTTDELIKEGQDLIDTTVRPALIDLNNKLEKERKKWFYRILSHLNKGLGLSLSNPPITQQQLITNALIMGTDVIKDTARNMQTIESLKNEAGLTFLLELDRLVNKK